MMHKKKNKYKHTDLPLWEQNSTLVTEKLKFIFNNKVFMIKSLH
jgi:hypothetical protein